jgi:hypothetical protein
VNENAENLKQEWASMTQDNKEQYRKNIEMLRGQSQSIKREKPRAVLQDVNKTFQNINNEVMSPLMPS